MSPIKVLYAEDEIFLGKIVKESLESRGFKVIMETNGAAVLKAFESGKPDICILDIMMPNRNGYEVAEDIRALDENVPIIFLTAKTQTEDLVKGFQTGGNDYIRKPFSMEELIVRIENSLRIRKSNTPAIRVPESFAIGRYVYHLNRQALVFGQTERKLSYRESELLKQLWQARDRIISREDVLQTIWGNDSFLNSRNLDVYITRLRNYLREDDQVEILTIKGVGYRFILPPG
jgi:DNA-binding response OmpR family regulator